MIKVEQKVTAKPDVVITLDGNTARELRDWLADADTPAGTPYSFWDALDDVVNGDARSTRPREE